MKVEIDLNDILGDEEGAETLNESIRRQVVEAVTKTVQDGIGKRIDLEISKVIDDELKKSIEIQMPDIVNDLMNCEYQQVDTWGSRTGDKTTFRKQLIKLITDQMCYKKSQYDSDKNIFTRAVDGAVADNVSKFQSVFNKQIDTQFIQECMDYAATKLADRLKIKGEK